MTRLELLQLVLGRARANGFEFRRWYTARLGLPWISSEAALNLLETQRRYYALVFSHEFAQTFWKPGEDITFDVPPQTFTRVMPDGSSRIVSRRAFIRRSARPHAWKYHLRQMALAEEPLRYLRKYLHIEEDLSEETKEDPPVPQKAHSVKETGRTTKKRTSRPLPTELPAFLQRPYRPGEKL
jgi:hypothetical protein